MKAPIEKLRELQLFRNDPEPLDGLNPSCNIRRYIGLESVRFVLRLMDGENVDMVNLRDVWSLIGELQCV